MAAPTRPRPITLTRSIMLFVLQFLVGYRASKQCNEPGGPGSPGALPLRGGDGDGNAVQDGVPGDRVDDGGVGEDVHVDSCVARRDGLTSAREAVPPAVRDA